MPKVKGLGADAVLRKLRAGHICKQRLRNSGRFFAPYFCKTDMWRFEDGQEVTNVAVSVLRKRGQIAVSVSATHRFLKVISEGNCNACSGS